VFRATSVVGIMSGLLGLAPPAEAVPIANPSNGHYYERINTPGLTWLAAKNAAEALTFQGIQGHLAVITSAAEDAFIINNFQVFTSVDAGGIGFGPWIGAFCAVGNCSLLAAYEWVNGEAFTYNGFGSNEPSGDGAAGTDAGVQYLNFRNGWNDSDAGENRPPGFIVEFDVVAAAEPVSLALFAFGAAGLAWARRRKHV
jgi:hypothetical protein